MPKPRSEARDKAYEIWAKSRGKKKLVDIAKELGVPDSKVRKWKSADKWSEKLKSAPQRGAKSQAEKDAKTTEEKPKRKRGAPLGNKNAVGHKSSSPLRNTNAVKTGQYQTIWLDALDESEKTLFEQVTVDPLEGIEEEIRLLVLRERRMLKLLAETQAQKDDLMAIDIYEYGKKPVVMEVEDDEAESTEEIITSEHGRVAAKRIETRRMLTDKIIAIENALTKIQEKKINALERKEKILHNREMLKLKERLVKHKEDWG